jgi:hypothetical protein
MLIKEEKIKFAQIQAFRLFLEEGLDKVKELYPEQIEFVTFNQDKSFTEVEKMVMA